MNTFTFRSILYPRLSRRNFSVGGFILALLASAGSALAQGSLTPPGPPAPTMKTLDQVEPRTNLQATPASAGVDTANPAWHFIINQPGSYYLSANLSVTKTNGIQINAEGVTLDLNGFQISRPTSDTVGAGISISSISHRCVVKNGSIKGFADGVSAAGAPDAMAKGGAYFHLAVSGCSGVGLRSGEGWQLSHCRATDNGGIGISVRNRSEATTCVAYKNGGDGISAGGGVSLSNCISTFNQGAGVVGSTGGRFHGIVAANNTGDGIRAGVFSLLSDCEATNNQSTYGIYAGQGSTLSHCIAAQNTRTNSPSYGIYVTIGCTVSACTSHKNTGTGTGVQGIGIHAGIGSTITGCTVESNDGGGIQVTGASIVSKNQCNRNGTDTDPAAGIVATGSNNRIEANNVTGNGRGIEVNGAGNLIVKNSAADNVTNYEIAANNRYGAIVDLTATGTAAVSGNSATATTVSTNPWANFAY